MRNGVGAKDSGAMRNGVGAKDSGAMRNGVGQGHEEGFWRYEGQCVGGKDSSATRDGVGDKHSIALKAVSGTETLALCRMMLRTRTLAL